MLGSEIPFHPEATHDYEEAYIWYFAHGTGLAAEFECEIERGLGLIAGNPLRWPKFDAQRRRLVLRKFPYSIVYEIVKEKIVVLAIAHGRRRPYYWRAKLKRYRESFSH